MSFLSPTSLSAKPTTGRSEYGRVKVALPPGRGLMDWVRLTTGKFLARQRLPAIDHVELIKHNSRSDCWIHIFGQVYDVTAYLEFHPGGVDELMRAAGRDATALFNEYHAWVNYENMLKSCLVGRFTGDVSKLPATGPPTEQNQPILNKRESPEDSVINPSLFNIRVVCTKNMLTISSPDWTDLISDNIVITLSSKQSSLRVLVRHFKQISYELLWSGLSSFRNLLSLKLNGTNKNVPEELCDNNYSVEASGSQFTLVFDSELDITTIFSDEKCSAQKRPGVQYIETIVDNVMALTHDTVLISATLPKGVSLRVPLGHHVSIKVKRGASICYRPYTPVSYDRHQPNKIDFLIKIYEDGVCTPSIAKLGPGDVMEISDPIGDIDFSRLILSTNRVILLAAGTGLTPMVHLIAKRISTSCEKSNTKLLLFNKSEKDIVKDDWMPTALSGDHSKIEVTHVLSQPSSDWTGASGRISTAILPSPSAEGNDKIFICGPDQFVVAATRCVSDAGYKTDQIHVFQG